MRTILSRALAELNAHRSVVLVTIVAEQGSAPRGPGSQMLVGADGQLTGTIGGGQVERQSELLALSLLKEQRSQIQHFALTQAGADSLGMACGGDVTVLFQFISPEDALWQSVLETALAQLTAAQPGWLILRTDGSAPALLDGEGMAPFGQQRYSPPLQALRPDRNRLFSPPPHWGAGGDLRRGTHRPGAGPSAAQCGVPPGGV